jgi:hypothetical protein
MQMTTNLPSNKWVEFSPRDVRNINVVLKSTENEVAMSNIKTLCECQLKFDKKINAFILKKTDLQEFIEALDSVAEANEDESEPEENDLASSSEDDETIQFVLAKNLKHKSAGDVIPETNISDSELEESISLSRRLRHVYSKLESLERRLAALENNKV